MPREQTNRLIGYLGFECFRMSQLHRAATETYARRATRLTIVNMASSIAILFLAANHDARFILDVAGKQMVGHFLDLNLFSSNQINFGELALGIISTIVVATTALQYLLRYEERNLIHKYVAADYENIFRKTERLLSNENTTEEELHRLNKQINGLCRHSPPVSTHIHLDTADNGYDSANIHIRDGKRPPTRLPANATPWLWIVTTVTIAIILIGLAGR